MIVFDQESPLAFKVTDLPYSSLELLQKKGRDDTTLPRRDTKRTLRRVFAYLSICSLAFIGVTHLYYRGRLQLEFILEEASHPPSHYHIPLSERLSLKEREDLFL